MNQNAPDHIRQITYWDGDVIEERNLERQLFTPDQVGMTKSRAAGELFPMEGMLLATRGDFNTHASPEIKEGSSLIMATDNVESRILALDMADRKNLAVLSAANATADDGLGIGSTAWYYHPDFFGSHKDPRVRHNLESEASQAHIRVARPCSEVSEPQTALANNGAAQRCLELLTLWSSDVDPQYLPFEHSIFYKQEAA